MHTLQESHCKTSLGNVGSREINSLIKHTFFTIKQSINERIQCWYISTSIKQSGIREEPGSSDRWRYRSSKGCWCCEREISVGAGTTQVVAGLQPNCNLAWIGVTEVIYLWNQHESNARTEQWENSSGTMLKVRLRENS